MVTSLAAFTFPVWFLEVTHLELSMKNDILQKTWRLLLKRGFCWVVQSDPRFFSHCPVTGTSQPLSLRSFLCNRFSAVPDPPSCSVRLLFSVFPRSL